MEILVSIFPKFRITELHLVVANIPLLLLLIACNKKSVVKPDIEAPVNTELISGIPATDKINAYLYACNYTVTNMFSGVISKKSEAYATFNDPVKTLTKSYNRYFDFHVGGDFLGNVSVGDLRVNNVLLSPRSSSSGHIYELSLNNSRLSQPLNWSSEGNKTYKSIDIILSPGFPQILYGDSATTFKRSRDTIIDLNQIFSAYDSVHVVISSSNIVLTKRIAAPANKVTIKKSEFGKFDHSGFAQTRLYAFKYYYQTINNKLYLFELSTKIIIPLKWLY